MIIGADEDVPPSREGAEAVLAFLPVFEDPRFLPEVVVAEEQGWTLEQYTREVYDFERALYRGGFIVRFDWSSWGREAFRYYRDPSLIDTADCAVVRRLLTYHVRKNVVCEGHLAGMIREGHLQVILRRLRTLAGTASED